MTNLKKPTFRHPPPPTPPSQPRAKRHKTETELVLYLLKGGFEVEHGITFERFMKNYNLILEKTPEKLI